MFWEQLKFILNWHLSFLFYIYYSFYGKIHKKLPFLRVINLQRTLTEQNTTSVTKVYTYVKFIYRRFYLLCYFVDSCVRYFVYVFRYFMERYYGSQLSYKSNFQERIANQFLHSCYFQQQRLFYDKAHLFLY